MVSTIDPDLQYGDDHEYIAVNDLIPTTNAEDEAFHIRDTVEQWPINRVSGHVILNQCGSLSSRRDHEIKGSSKHQFFLQKSTQQQTGKVFRYCTQKAYCFRRFFHLKTQTDFLV